MDLESKKTFDSKTTPGVRFTLRRLNQRQRAICDLSIADKRLECDTVIFPLQELEKEWKGREKECPPDIVREFAALNYKLTLLGNAYIKPATIRAAFVSIEKVGDDGKREPCTVDGKPYTAETFVELCDNDALMNEVWEEARVLSGSPPLSTGTEGNSLTIAATPATTTATSEIEIAPSSTVAA